MRQKDSSILLSEAHSVLDSINIVYLYEIPDNLTFFSINFQKMRSVKHGGKKGMRYRYKSAAIKRQNKNQKKKMRKIAGCQTIDNAWKTRLTTRQNLAAMGLAYDPNEVIGMNDGSTIMEVDELDLNEAKFYGSVRNQKARNKERRKTAGIEGNKTDGKTSQVLKELEQIALVEANALVQQTKQRKLKAKLLQNDISFCEKMIAIHGSDYEAMSRDPANIWQNTPRQIEQKINVYHRSIKEA